MAKKDNIKNKSLIVKTLLQENIVVSEHKLKFLGEGEFFTAWEYDKGKIVRCGLNDLEHRDQLKREMWASNLACQYIKTSKTNKIIVNEKDNIIASLSNKISGITEEKLDSCSLKTNNLNQEIVLSLKTIHNIPIDYFSGWGYIVFKPVFNDVSFDLLAEGEHKTCKDWFNSCQENFMSNFENIKENKNLCLETKNLYFQRLEEHDNLIKKDFFVPRSLNHGDFGGNNLIVSESNCQWSISGVIDWGGARFSDPLDDLAWIEMWKYYNQNPDNPNQILALYCKNNSLDKQRYRRAWLCRTLHITGFYSKNHKDNIPLDFLKRILSV